MKASKAKWRLYEMRKEALKAAGLSAAEYAEAVRKLAEEMGL